MQVKKQPLEKDMEQWNGSKLGKEYKAVYCHPAYLIHMQSTSCEMPGWIYHKLESRLLGEIQRTSGIQMIPCNRRKWRGTKEPLGEGEKAGLKLNIQKTDHGFWSHHFMANRRGRMEAVTYFIFLGSKFIVDGDWKQKMQRHLLLGRKLWQT